MLSQTSPILLILVYCCIVAAATPTWDAFFSQVGKQDLTNAFVSIVQAQQGQTFAKGYGTTVESGAIPPTNDTIYSMGTACSLFSALLAQKLFETQQLQLENSTTLVSSTIIGNYDCASGYPRYPATSNVTLKALLCQTSGLDHKSYTDPNIPPRIRNANKIIETNVHNAFVANKLMESQTGKTFTKLLQEYYLTPMNLKQTFTEVKAVPSLISKQGYIIDLPPLPYALQTIYTSARDMSELILMLLRNGTTTQQAKLLDAPSQLWKEQFGVLSSTLSQGLAFSKLDYQSMPVYYIIGEHDPLASLIVLIPSRNVGAVVFVSGTIAKAVAYLKQAIHVFVQSIVPLQCGNGKIEQNAFGISACLRSMAIPANAENFETKAGRAEGCYVSTKHSHSSWLKWGRTYAPTLCISRAGSNFLSVRGAETFDMIDAQGTSTEWIFGSKTGDTFTLDDNTHRCGIIENSATKFGEYFVYNGEAYERVAAFSFFGLYVFLLVFYPIAAVGIFLYGVFLVWEIRSQYKMHSQGSYLQAHLAHYQADELLQNNDKSDTLLPSSLDEEERIQVQLPTKPIPKLGLRFIIIGHLLVIPALLLTVILNWATLVTVVTQSPNRSPQGIDAALAMPVVSLVFECIIIIAGVATLTITRCLMDRYNSFIHASTGVFFAILLNITVVINIAFFILAGYFNFLSPSFS